MEIIKLKPDQMEFFSHLDPFDFASISVLPGAFALGAVEQDEDGNDIPAGLCVFRKTTDSLRIEWIAVANDYQMQGIGDELCYSVVTLAKDMGVPRVEAAFYENPGRDEICEGEREYFMDRDFDRDGGDVCYAMVTLSEIRNLPYFNGSRGVKKLTSLSKMTSAEIKTMTAELEGKKHYGAICPIADGVDSISKELSYSIPSASGTGGGLLVFAEGGVIAPVAMGANDDVLVPSLLYTALEASDIFDEKTNVIIMPGDTIWNQMMETILVEHVIRGRLLVYDVNQN